MSKLLLTLLVLCVAVWSFLLGLLTPLVASTEVSNLTYLKQNDRGCDDINARPNAYTHQMDIVCEVQMQSEDDALFVIKLNGARDDY